MAYQKEGKLINRISPKLKNIYASPFLVIIDFYFNSSFTLNFFFLLYNIVLVLLYIDMNLPLVYMCSPSWIPLPPPSPSHLSGSSQCTSPEHPVSCIVETCKLYVKWITNPDSMHDTLNSYSQLPFLVGSLYQPLSTEEWKCESATAKQTWLW